MEEGIGSLKVAGAHRRDFLCRVKTLGSCNEKDLKKRSDSEPCHCFNDPSSG